MSRKATHRPVATIEAELAAFEAQFRPVYPPAGTPDRCRIIDRGWLWCRAASHLPENVARRKALWAERAAAQRSERARAAASRRAASPQAQLRAWIYRQLRQMGFAREHASESGSAYYFCNGLSVRVSNHAVPLTASREAAWTNGARSWAENRWSLDSLDSKRDAARWLVEVRREVRQREARPLARSC